MRVGVPRETSPDEQRVALVPDVVSRLDGIDVVVERGAGTAAGFPDEAYTAAGAALTDDPWREVEAVVKVAKPTREEANRLHRDQILIAFLQPLADREGIDRLAAAG